MTVEVIIANENLHAGQIRELFWEYLQWANARVNEEFGVNFEIESMIETDMQHLDIYMPPTGRLLLGYDDGSLAGIVCLRYMAPKVAEIKRMFVRAQNRQRGLGRMLLEWLLSEAVLAGYERVRLDSARFMKEAHQLYRAIGFKEIEAYEGSEIPKEFQKNWIFMEIKLMGKMGKGGNSSS